MAIIFGQGIRGRAFLDSSEIRLARLTNDFDLFNKRQHEHAVSAQIFAVSSGDEGQGFPGGVQHVSETNDVRLVHTGRRLSKPPGRGNIG